MPALQVFFPLVGTSYKKLQDYCYQFFYTSGDINFLELYSTLGEGNSIFCCTDPNNPNFQ